MRMIRSLDPKNWYRFFRNHHDTSPLHAIAFCLYVLAWYLVPAGVAIGFVGSLITSKPSVKVVGQAAVGVIAVAAVPGVLLDICAGWLSLIPATRCSLKELPPIALFAWAFQFALLPSRRK
jgi:hypothetical protein